MIIYIAILIAFAFLSYAIDVNLAPDILPRAPFLHVNNFIILGLGIFLLIRIRIKIMQGSLEKIQREHHDLSRKAESNRIDGLQKQIDELKTRLSKMEEGK